MSQSGLTPPTQVFLTPPTLTGVNIREETTTAFITALEDSFSLSGPGLVQNSSLNTWFMIVVDVFIFFVSNLFWSGATDDCFCFFSCSFSDITFSPLCSFVPQTFCWSVRPTFPPRTSSAGNPVREQRHRHTPAAHTLPSNKHFNLDCWTHLDHDLHPLYPPSVQSDQEPASSHPLHRAGPQPLQVPCGGLHQVLQEGQPAALPHQVLPL